MITSKREAVVGFEEKYKSEILTPSGLKNGTGFVGPATRKKLNQLYGCGVIATPSITVLSPNGGETWQVGKTHVVSWNANNVPTDCEVSVTLFDPRGEGMAYGGGNVLAVKGNYSFTVTSNIPVGNNYKIQVIGGKSCSPATNVSDQSDNYFGIVAATTPTTCTDSDGGINYNVEGECTSGNIGMGDYCSYSSGRAGVLKEASCGSGGCVREDYICPLGQICRSSKCLQGNLSDAICTETDNGADAYVKGRTYSIVHTGADDSCYVSASRTSAAGVLTESCGSVVSGGGYCGVYEYYCSSADYDSSKFIECPNGCKNGACLPANITPSITVTSPNGGETWTVGNTYQIKWMSSGVDKVGIDIQEGGYLYAKTIATDISASLGTYSYSIPKDIVSSLSYKISVYKYPIPDNALISPWAHDQSDNYFSIIAATAAQPSISISGSSGNQTNSSALTVSIGNTFTISGVPQNLQGLSYWFGSGFPPSGYYNRAFFFDQTFGNNNFCGNNEASVNGPWTMTCTAKVAGSSNIYIAIYANGQIYESNVVSVTIASPAPADCAYLSNGITSTYLQSCGSSNYNPIFDLNKDKIINALDSSLLSAHITDAAWCATKKAETTNPCVTPASCTYLQQGVTGHYLGSCGTVKYDPVFDLNKDKIINALDISLITTKINDAAWCDAMKAATTNPCPTTQVGSLYITNDLNRPISQGVIMGRSNVAFNSIKFTSINEPVYIKSIKITLAEGSVNSLVPGKTCLYDGNTQLACTVVGADVDGAAVFNFPAGSYLTIPYPGSKTITMKADIADYISAHSGDAVKFNLSSPSDVTALGASSNSVISPTGEAAIGNAMYLFRTLPTVSLNASSPSGNQIGGSNQTVFKFNVTLPSTGFAAKINSIKFTLHAYSGASTTVFGRAYKLYKSTDESTIVGQGVSTANNIATDARGWVTISPNPASEVGDNSTVTYVLKADTSAMDTSQVSSQNWYISIDQGDFYWDDSSGINTNKGIKDLPISGSVLVASTNNLKNIEKQVANISAALAELLAGINSLMR